MILRKIIKIIATRCHILRLKCTKFDFGCGSAPDPAGGAYSAPILLAGFKGPLRGREGEGMERDGKRTGGRKGWRREGGKREWEGRDRTWGGEGKERRKGGEGLQLPKLQFLAPPLTVPWYNCLLIL